MDKPGNQSPPHTPVSRYSDAQKDPSWRGAALHAWGWFVFLAFLCVRRACKLNHGFLVARISADSA